jgi:hypothetical protein
MVDLSAASRAEARCRLTSQHAVVPSGTGRDRFFFVPEPGSANLGLARIRVISSVCNPEVSRI